MTLRKERDLIVIDDNDDMNVNQEVVALKEKILEKDEEISKKMGMLQDLDTENKDLKHKREIELLQAEEKIKGKDEEIRKLTGMLQNLEIETKDLKHMVEKN